MILFLSCIYCMFGLDKNSFYDISGIMLFFVDISWFMFQSLRYSLGFKPGFSPNMYLDLCSFSTRVKATNDHRGWLGSFGRALSITTLITLLFLFRISMICKQQHPSMIKFVKVRAGTGLSKVDRSSLQSKTLIPRKLQAFIPL
jgi:hypothetical protein